MSETSRRGSWLVPQRLDLLAVMADTTIDLTQASLPTGIIDIHIRSVWAAVKIVVPPGLQVVNRLSSLMASVAGGGEPNEASEPGGGWKEGTVIRLTGWALMAEIQTKVRRRERLSNDVIVESENDG
jgi:Cell wall-active antibiotics response 4TMS YvqF